MSLMYEVNTINAAMVKAAEICRQDMPEGEKVNAVLACFAGMKPVEAELVVHAHWYGSEFDGYADGNPVYDTWGCSHCHEEVDSDGYPPSHDRCPHCGAYMDEDATLEIDCRKCRNCDLKNGRCKLYGPDPAEAVARCAANGFQGYEQQEVQK